MSTYVQKYEKLNFSVFNLNVSGVATIGGSNILNLIDEATSDPYVLPIEMFLSNLTVEKVKGIGFPEYVFVQGSLYPDGNLHQIGDPAQLWLEGNFVSVYADNLEVGDGSGTTQRVLL